VACKSSIVQSFLKRYPCLRCARFVISNDCSTRSQHK
jgi:hypothetical protein